MNQEILISVEHQEKRVAIIEDKTLEEFYVERQDAQKLVGNIYKGVVQTIVPAIGAAFIKMGLGKNGFLYVQDLTQPDYEKMAELIDRPYSYDGAIGSPSKSKHPGDIKRILKAGQEILVQVVKEPLGTKGPRLTTHIALPGRYLVLMPCDSHLGVSRKIQENKERARLRELLKQLNAPSNIGLIVRTVASGSTKRDFVQDLRYLMNLWRRIKGCYQRRPAPALVHEEYDLVLRIIRDKFSAQTSRLLVDSKEEYKRIMRFLNIFAPNFKSRVQFYRSDLPLFGKSGVEEEISKVYERKVQLKSGGYIMLEPTESLVAIDVNSAKFTSKRDIEETAYMVNLEAAKEIARQIRLRDIGGIIIIDFIDMNQAGHRRKVFDTLNAALKRDHAKTDISSVSKLGLIEMTRQRTRKSIESVIYHCCPYCQGKGLIKSPATMAILALRKLKKMLPTINRRTVLLLAHPDVSSRLTNQNRQSIYNLERKFKVKILIRQDSKLHMEECKIEVV